MWWIGWVLWFLYFAGYEGYTIFNKAKGDTLSETLRNWFHTDTKAGRYGWIVFLGLLFGWLIVHIAVAGSA